MRLLATAPIGERRHARFDAVHVVTVTHNSASTIGAWLRGLVGSSHQIAAVTVVDNASTDATVQVVRSLAPGCPFPVSVIVNENTGFAGGYAAASDDVVAPGTPVLCLNPDVIIEASAIDAMLDVLDSFTGVGIVTVPLVEADGTADSASRRRLPTLGSSMLYSVLGRITPARFRYNSQRSDPTDHLTSRAGRSVSRLEATTGAMMLIDPSFRTLKTGIFDTDYWMYGEDLQLCADARASSRSVLMAEVEPSVHIKGVSSGRPRSRRSNRAFHDAMKIYVRKNLLRHPLAIALIDAAVELHFQGKEAVALPARVRRLRSRSASGLDSSSPSTTRP